MRFKTAKDITAKDIEWALDEAFKTVMRRLGKETADVRDTDTDRRVGH